VISSIVDRGEVLQPTLARIGATDVGAWVHNRNGATDLMGLVLTPDRPLRVFRLVGGAAPLEHPYVFSGPSDLVDIVFSWQRYGNFDLFFGSMRLGHTHFSVLRRLTHAEFYSFFPRAVSGRSGTIYLLHFESCCQPQLLNVVYDRLNRAGQTLGPSHVLYQITSFAGTQSVPLIGADMIRDSQGNIWGAFAGDGGAYVFEVTSQGHSLRAPKLVFNDGTVTRWTRARRIRGRRRDRPPCHHGEQCTGSHLAGEPREKSVEL
jgi:hypothetical protein